MQTGEVFAWIIFFVIISLLFFAAFGSQNINEKTIEEYIDALMAEENNTNGGNRWVWKCAAFHVAKQTSQEESKGHILEIKK